MLAKENVCPEELKNIQAWEKRRGFVSLSSGVSSSKGLGMRTVQQEERTRLGMRWEPGWG